jgi:GNAT superfamily N-acetyltransferase
MDRGAILTYALDRGRPAMTPAIVPLDRAHEPALLEMWRAYQEFYRVGDIDEARNRAHVGEILENPALGHIHLALLEGMPVGFSTIYYTFASTRSCKIALLNDLFVVPEQRRSGIGRALLEHALDHARGQGIRIVRWSTSASNVDAQRLYAGYGEPTSWKLYSVDVSARPVR